MKPIRFENPIYVTKPFLPSIDEFTEGLKEIWNNQWLTNHGPVFRRFENVLANHFETENLNLFTNGTLALQIGLQGMRITGEVITTPYSFVATTHALFWNKVRPVFVDIEPDYYTIDPKAVEAAITPWTTAILAVHVYGYPCKLNALADVARRHKLILIYDAAHAFGTKVGGESLCHFGDMSMFSFHATKLFHSIEGGMLTFKDHSLKRMLEYLSNFGFENELEVVMPGTNAKMNEMQALMGTLVLKHLGELIEHSRCIDETYRECLKDVPGIKFPPQLPDNVSYNYAYQPAEILEEEFGMNRDELYNALKEYNVFARRYFYPLICDYPCYRNVSVQDELRNSRIITKRILTLPTYYDLSIDDVERICCIIQHIQNGVRRCK
jgi:dTDP-4-amino-4,6-dideoxygalactose transaminase